MMVRYLKRLKSSRLGRVQAFPMYGGLGMSAPSLHRESTDSPIYIYFSCNYDYTSRVTSTCRSASMCYVIEYNRRSSVLLRFHLGLHYCLHNVQVLK